MKRNYQSELHDLFFVVHDDRAVGLPEKYPSMSWTGRDVILQFRHQPILAQIVACFLQDSVHWRRSIGKLT